MSDLFLPSKAQMRGIERVFPLSHGVPRVNNRRVISGITFVINDRAPAPLSIVAQLDERLAALWDERRAARAMVRFGDRDLIIQRARHEERLSRAA